MCGRYILREQQAAERHWNLHGPPAWLVSYNICPSMAVAAVRPGEGGLNDGTSLRWGLVPYWAHGVTPKYSTCNATLERLAEAPTYRGAWRRGQRCILPASGFYEWQVRTGGKQPYFIRLADREVFGFAGLWDRSVAPDGTVVLSCTLITMPANPLLAQIHNAKQRMPAILHEEDHEAWLRGPPEDAGALLQPYPADEMLAWPVSTRVNSPRHDGEDLVAPLEP
jgi:putative SOS response-associated peptidase YedK